MWTIVLQAIGRKLYQLVAKTFNAENARSNQGTNTETTQDYKSHLHNF